MRHEPFYYNGYDWPPGSGRPMHKPMFRAVVRTGALGDWLLMAAGIVALAAACSTIGG